MKQGSEKTAQAIRGELIELSHQLGLESRQLAILGEGNTSADCGDGTFWVKASGSSLTMLSETDLSRVRFDAVLELLERETITEQEVETELYNVLTDPDQKKPSVETFLHALCLSEGDAKWVGHTHTVSVNRILCSALGAKPFLGHLFPDAVVVCGRTPAVVPYVDPGFELAKAVQAELRRYRSDHGKAPKLLLMVNHGPVALGQTAKEVVNIMLMADKWAKILWGTYALGGPQFLPEDEVGRIDNRLDEHFRRRQLTGG
jgi:rhamnose utilization protein RhaD (predicted bifunctional aldolase and dehydrogenase)